MSDHSALRKRRTLPVDDRRSDHHRLQAASSACSTARRCASGSERPDRARPFWRRVADDFIAAPPDKKAFFAIAVIRLDGHGRSTSCRRNSRRRPMPRRLGRAQRADRPGGLQRPAVVAAMGARHAGGDGALDRHAAGPARPSSASSIRVCGVRAAACTPTSGTVEPLVVCQPPGLFPRLHRPDGHGTFLAGTMAAVPDNDAGIASPIVPRPGTSACCRCSSSAPR